MAKYKVVIFVYDPNDLEKIIKNLFSDNNISMALREGKKRYNEYCLYKFDGKTSKRVVALIENVLKI